MKKVATKGLGVRERKFGFKSNEELSTLLEYLRARQKKLMNQQEAISDELYQIFHDIGDVILLLHADPDEIKRIPELE